MTIEATSTVRCRPADIGDMRECADIVNRWIDETAWMPRVHTHADVERHYRESVFPERRVFVAEIGQAVAAFIALSEDCYVTALYVDRPVRGAGCGKALIDIAKECHPNGLRLWTFQANSAAQRFYAWEGFREVRCTNGDNEEGLPDILLEWTPGS